MSLSFGKHSPQDLLGKAERDHARLVDAHTQQDLVLMSDAVFDLAVALTSLKDWVKEHPGNGFTRGAVEKYVENSVALSSFRDIANGGKHRIIKNYQPTTHSVASSASAAAWPPTASLCIDGLAQGHTSEVLKVVRVDGTRLRAVDLGREALAEWRAFFQKYGI